MLGGKAFVNGIYDGSNQNRPKADLQLDLSEVDIQKRRKLLIPLKNLLRLHLLVMET